MIIIIFVNGLDIKCNVRRSAEDPRKDQGILGNDFLGQRNNEVDDSECLLQFLAWISHCAMFINRHEGVVEIIKLLMHEEVRVAEGIGFGGPPWFTSMRVWFCYIPSERVLFHRNFTVVARQLSGRYLQA
ncbi:hypothetical protein NMG60_11003509 [Bertholletia excelsa]